MTGRVDEEDFRAAWGSGARLADIAARFGISVSTVKNTRIALGLPPRHRGGAGRAQLDEAAFRAAWADPRLSRDEIARRFGLSISSVALTVKRLGLPPRPAAAARRAAAGLAGPARGRAELFRDRPTRRADPAGCQRGAAPDRGRDGG